MPLGAMLYQTECSWKVFFFPPAVTEICLANVNSWNYIHSVGIVESVHMCCLKVESYFLSVLTWGGGGGVHMRSQPEDCFQHFALFFSTPLF